MGNTACCAQKDSAGDKKATTQADELSRAEAVPVVDEPGFSYGALSGPTPEELAAKGADKDGMYRVTLDKAGGMKLGLDVDYMAERRVLPIMAITGGLAEQWNHGNPGAMLKKGDSVLEVNGTRGNVAIMLEKCKSEKMLHLLLMRSMTYDHLMSDLEDLVKSKSCGPLLLRLSWHDAGVFMEGQGGCPNAAMRFPDAGESKFPMNAGLPTVALNVLRPISDKYCPDLLSHADLWALAANVAIRVMGGPEVPTRFGRVDATSAADGVDSQEGRLPDAEKGAPHLRAIFHAKGFDDRAIVVLSGAHTVGTCHLDRSGFDGAWTEEPLRFDNSYFKELLAKSYKAETTAKGCPQHRHAASGTIMLNSDLALLSDPVFKQHVETYARDQGAFFTDFTVAWSKLQESGCDNLRDIL